MEEIQMIGEIIGNLSGDATTAFMMYLGYKLFCQIMGLAVTSGALWGVYKLIIASIHKTRFLCRIEGVVRKEMPFDERTKDEIIIALKRGWER